MKRKAPRRSIDISSVPLPAFGQLRLAKCPEDVRRWIRTYGGLTSVQAQLLSKQDMDRILADLQRQNRERFGPKG
jgi:hypothetical protein